MTHVHLPVEHTAADLALAGAVAELLASGELFVAWSQDAGAGRPVIAAAVRAAAAPPGPRRPWDGLRGALRRLGPRGRPSGRGAPGRP